MNSLKHNLDTFFTNSSVQHTLLNKASLWLRCGLQDVYWWQGRSMPSASQTEAQWRTPGLSPQECTTGIKKSDSDMGLSGQWCRDDWWKKEPSRIRVSRVELGSQEQGESSKSRSEQEKIEKPSVGKWATGINNDVWSEGYGTGDSEKGRKGFTNLFVQKLEGMSAILSQCHFSFCCVFWMV